ncbi:hypothetical protein [Roseimaritima ulvae]|uniref:General secretion pathway, M protein n=1 Tax=Roseimaritima ulvae TaxID=980254 RepID=A0A5B9QI87_9BACT|nr:hypothetical protein [Roseimaritima ulvae]QEG38584.1 hypothetical protein UC8_05410 [Roseimaritima ulvae]
MASKPQKNWRSECAALADSLREPFRMRLLVAGGFAALMFFVIGEPSHGKLQRGHRELRQWKQQIATAEQVALLDSRVAELTPRLITGSGTDPVLNHMLTVIRNSAADLVRLDAEAAARLGPYEAVRLQIELTGSFAALDQVLQKINNDSLLLRMDSFVMTADQRDPSQTSLQLTVLMLKERT